MTFTAKDSSICGRCGRKIARGNAVDLVDDQVVHADCPDPLSPGSTADPCGSCFCYHVGDCA